MRRGSTPRRAALAAAQQVTEPGQKAVALAHVAVDLMMERDYNRASNSLTEALNLANQVSRDDEQSEFHLAISRAHSLLRLFREARIEADKCRRSEYRLAGYTSLLTEYEASRIGANSVAVK